jgi:hypothetical protein
MLTPVVVADRVAAEQQTMDQQVLATPHRPLQFRDMLAVLAKCMVIPVAAGAAALAVLGRLAPERGVIRQVALAVLADR